MAVRDWLATFKDEVVAVEQRVSRDLEATEHLLRNPHNPVWFKDLDGYEAVGNLWSTRDRIASALKTDRRSLMLHILDAMRHPKDFEVTDKAGFLKNQSEDFDLRESPIPKYYPKDAGRYITSGVWVAEWEGKRNLSFHRTLILDDKRGTARIVPRHLYHMYRSALEAGQELKVAICIGLDPWNLIAGGTSVEYGRDEMTIAAALKERCLGETLKAVKIRSGLTVPAEAEYVLEGRLTAEKHKEGPFVDAVGTYDRVRDEPVVVIERVYNRDDPIFHAILSGGDEHLMFMGMPREPIIHEAVSRAVPHVAGVRLTEGGCAWLHGVVAIRKQSEGDGKNAIMAAFGAHTSMKRVIVVDEDIDVYNDRDVEWAVATRFQADKGLVVLHGARGSSLDPSATEVTSKVGIDATMPVKGGEGFEKAKL